MPPADQAAGGSAAAGEPCPLAPPGYEILRELGRGGMGVVFLAHHLGLKRVVALKMILAGGHAGEADLVRFLAEAEAVAHLQHANIVQIFEAGRHQGLPFFTLEYCPGGSLADKVRAAPLPPAEAARVMGNRPVNAIPPKRQRLSVRASRASARTRGNEAFSRGFLSAECLRP
jgi:hypothetical protein